MCQADFPHSSEKHALEKKFHGLPNTKTTKRCTKKASNLGNDFFATEIACDVTKKLLLPLHGRVT